MTSTTLQTLDKVDVVYIDIRAFSGMKTLDDSEVPLDDEEVTTKGSKWVIDKTHLRHFHRIRGEVARVGVRFGTRFMGGYAFPKDHTKAALAEFDRIRKEWDAIVDGFLQSYPTYVGEWASAKPKWAESIQRSAPSVEKLRKTFRFGYQAFQINPSGEPNAGSLVQEDLESMGFQVAKEVAQDLRDSFDGSQGQVTQRCRRVLERCKAKFQAFAFLDPMLGAAAGRIQEALNALPQTGPIKGNDFLVLAGLVGLLSQPHKVMAGQLTMEIPAADPNQPLFPEDEDEPDVAQQAAAVMMPPGIDSAALAATQSVPVAPAMSDMNW